MHVLLFGGYHNVIFKRVALFGANSTKKESMGDNIHGHSENW